MSKVSIAGLSKGAVLAALYNNSRPLGMGFLHYDPTPLSAEDAQGFINDGGGDDVGIGAMTNRPLYFDYLQGRVMKVDITGDEVEASGYDRDNGEGAVERVITQLRADVAANGDGGLDVDNDITTEILVIVVG